MRRSIGSLVRRNLSPREDETTRALSRTLRRARRRGYLTRSELIAACRWKSPRSIRHVESNTHHRIRAATTAALAASDEASKVDALVRLRGVSIPTASAILTLLSPRRYGVIDIRVWKLLHSSGAVRGNRDGVGFSTKNWLQFLGIIRRLGRNLGRTARTVERTLFELHRARQRGTLYRTKR